MTDSVAVYRHYNRDCELLYVGQTANPKRRLYEHKCRTEWADLISHSRIVWVGSREKALRDEEVAIREESPIYNKQNNVKLADDYSAHCEIYLLDAPAMNKFKEYRKAAGVTQTVLAQTLDISQVMVSDLESGLARPSLALAARIERLTDGDIMAASWIDGQ